MSIKNIQSVLCIAQSRSFDNVKRKGNNLFLPNYLVALKSIQKFSTKIRITYYKYTAVPEQKLKYGLQKRPRSDEIAAFFKYRRIF